ncbi:MAG: addiction module protein [Prosthecobacter sp.]
MSQQNDAETPGPEPQTSQLKEVQRRVEEVRSGRVAPIAGEQVFREVEQSLVARRSGA